jgi:hypothetical protein
VARDRPAIERRFADDWGIELPGWIFRYWLFLLSLGPVEQRALDDTDLRLYGIMDVFEDPACQPRDRIDIRVHGRYYRDPPEFLTFMHGGTDGLHFGLWYDTAELEWHQLHLDQEAGEDEPIAADLAEQRFLLRALREVLTAFETGDRPEEGNTYHDAWVTEALRRCAAGDPASALTLGRDLHWASGGDAERERQAEEPLAAAYRTFGRHDLAGVADAHHRHRDLPQVDVKPRHAPVGPRARKRRAGRCLHGGTCPLRVGRSSRDIVLVL